MLGDASALPAVCPGGLFNSDGTCAGPLSIPLSPGTPVTVSSPMIPIVAAPATPGTATIMPIATPVTVPAVSTTPYVAPAPTQYDSSGQPIAASTVNVGAIVVQTAGYGLAAWLLYKALFKGLLK